MKVIVHLINFMAHPNFGRDLFLKERKMYHIAGHCSLREEDVPYSRTLLFKRGRCAI